MNHKKLTTIIIAALALLVATLPTLAADLQKARVTRVVDGDTIEVRFNYGRSEKVRYIGMNTPETYGDTECFGKKASAYNKALVANKMVWLEMDVEKRDKYSRLLAYVYLDPNGDAMVNAILVAQGYAQMATYPPNVKYVDLFRELQRGAREDARGLWSECRGQEPSEEKQQPQQQQEDTSSSIVITCIHFDASGNDNTNENGEWVVLEAKHDTDLDGWTLSDEADHTYEFPSEFNLKKGEKVRVYTGSEDKPKKDTGCGQDADYELFWGSESAIWNNSGDVASLKQNGEIVVSCSYSGGGEEARCASP